jgi:hypothetical protein
MPRFEPTISVSELVKAFHALDRAVTVTGFVTTILLESMVQSIDTPTQPFVIPL